jgi:hypothetical protein
MNDTNTGGPAFPTARVNINGVDEQDGIQAFGAGMTLRDYFAAKAMQSTLADNAYVERTETTVEWLAIVAKSSYEIADAMLKARDAK